MGYPVRGGGAGAEMRRVWGLGVLVACAPPEQAPPTLDQLLRWFLVYHETGADADVDTQTAALEAAITTADGADTLIDGRLEALTEDEVATFNAEAANGPEALGLFMARPLDCTLAELEPVLQARDQRALYDGYRAYSRVYTSDFDAWQARETQRLTWDISLTGVYIVTEYDEVLRGGLRRLGGDGAGRPGLLQHTWMPEPAEFAGGNNSFEQDYQIELYWSWAGRTHHAYAIWRDVNFGGLTLEDDIVVNGILGALDDWDDRTEAWCASGLPEGIE